MMPRLFELESVREPRVGEEKVSFGRAEKHASDSLIKADYSPLVKCKCFNHQQGN